MKPRGGWFCRFTSVVLLLFGLLATSREAWAFKYRRPNLAGPYTDRRLTNPANAMSVLLGPGSAQMFGQRYDERPMEAGLQFDRLPPDGDPSQSAETEVWSRLGVAFGLLPHLDAGAVFLNFKYAPNFDFTEVLVFVTQTFPLKDWDLGIRLSFLTPSKSEGWQANPGLLANYHARDFKLELGALVPVGFGSLFRETQVADPHWIGLHLPVRATYNVSPAFYLGADTGFLVPRFDQSERTSVPFGVLAGTTMLSKARLIDLSLSFRWDDLVYLAPEESVRHFHFENFRINFGVTMHRMATPPPR